MPLPPAIARAIEEHVSTFRSSEIAAARERLTERYRPDPGRPAPPVDSDRAAYLVARAPATYAAARAVLAECAARSGGARVRSLLDLGAGPGTASWAAVDVFPSIEQVTHGEIDPAWRDIGKKLGRQSGNHALVISTWAPFDLATARPTRFDAVVISYALGELDVPARVGAALRAFEAANVFLAIVEPGTTAGFNAVRDARAALIEKGATILAPCTHEKPCPMSGDEWCRFAVRLPRSAAHRSAKGASKGYEDESYSYVVAAKVPRTGPAARIVRPPVRRHGHVLLDVCAADGLRRITVAKSDGAPYREARRAEWGGALDA